MLYSDKMRMVDVGVSASIASLRPVPIPPGKSSPLLMKHGESVLHKLAASATNAVVVMGFTNISSAELSLKSHWLSDKLYSYTYNFIKPSKLASLAIRKARFSWSSVEVGWVVYTLVRRLSVGLLRLVHTAD